MTMLPPPPEGVAIRAGRLFDPRTGTNLANQVIIIAGDRIVDVGPADRVKIPAGARVMDMSNATVLPGLIDRHVHLMQNQEPNDARALIVGQHYALADLYAGFTTVQDLNSPFTYATVELRDAINKGLITGPRMQVTGPLQAHLRAAPLIMRRRLRWALLAWFPECLSGRTLRTSIRHGWRAPPFASIRTTARTGSRFTTRKIMKAAAIRCLRVRAAFMPDGKMINVPSITLEENQAIVDEAHTRGDWKVACHAYGGEGLRNCLLAGVDMPIHVIVGVTGAEGLDDETIRLFKQPLADGTMRPVNQTLWDLAGPLEDADRKVTGGKKTRFALTELSFKRLVAAGITETFGSGVCLTGHGVAGLPVRAVCEMGAFSGASAAHGYQRRHGWTQLRPGQADRLRRKRKIRRHGSRFREPSRRHHGNGAREIRDEGRRGVSQRFQVNANCADFQAYAGFFNEALASSAHSDWPEGSLGCRTLYGF